ncbi:TPA: hypothetical protein ACJEU7_003370 [Acinetobacter baumannii]|uniref:hypothetical protein n=1 Tax=Acinetobacter baumannii TaxID=470 RepID=UPI0022579CB0|nr:hypothetical protein [Acinetobacter baumannii]MCX3034185.1 hypothetical protein [Acinetobacter baumannii]
MRNLNFNNSYLSAEALSLVECLNVSTSKKLLALIPLHIRNALYSFILYFSLSFAFTASLMHTKFALPSFGLILYVALGWCFLLFLLYKTYKNNFIYLTQKELKLSLENADTEMVRQLLMGVNSSFKFISRLDLAYLLSRAANNLINENADAELLVYYAFSLLECCEKKESEYAIELFDRFLETPTFRLIIQDDIEIHRKAFNRLVGKIDEDAKPCILYIISLTGVSASLNHSENIDLAKAKTIEIINKKTLKYINNLLK